VVAHDHRPSSESAGCWPDTPPGAADMRCEAKYTPHAVLRALFGPPLVEEAIGQGWLSLYAVDGLARPAGGEPGS